MAFIKKTILFYMIVTLIAVLYVTEVLADGTQVSMITKTFSGIGTDLITVTLPVQYPTVNPSAPTCGGSLPTNMGFIGIECRETTQPGTLPYLTTSFTAQGTSSVDTLTVPTQTVTSFTTLVSSFVSTMTEPPQTITRTVSEVVPSMTVTAMCDWPEDNIITPCTTVVLATGLVTAAVPTTSKSAAISSTRNPVKVITTFSKLAARKALNFLTGLTSFISAGAVGDINEGAFQALKRVQPRQIYRDCRQVPALYTPLIMTVISILNGIFLFYAFDINNPRRTALATTTYVLTFIIVYVIVIYVEYYNISVGPTWNQCFSAMAWYNDNEHLAGKA